MAGALNMIKLCVGADEVEDLVVWQRQRMEEHAAAGRPAIPRHVTRMWPKRAAEILDGGSLYWVFRGEIRARQRITGFEEVFGEDGIRRCAIQLDPEVVLTRVRPRRAFQGWRYLASDDAPDDLASTGAEDRAALPEALRRHLDDIGIG
ncbi:DUF1489 family protein (plasmid) [Paroceanicella profunda]|uniref:DUF1489 family protein n=1 Tax=Paroceanicella profunda TaxID=2579971 RepID=A0A5B8G480_9RHOB|nr:DUF1489 domain-containing protein [Paroceanicella profunda]QDL94122.1 DUF1489 family protein [Paroceanicella profunda]